jgi:hypothetical protein
LNAVEKPAMTAEEGVRRRVDSNKKLFAIQVAFQQ